MKPLFPIEITKISVEEFYAKQSQRSLFIYGILIVISLIGLISLPFIRVDVTVQGNGIVRSSIDDTIIQSAVTGEVIHANIEDNRNVSQGDTLVVISTAVIDRQVQYVQSELIELQLFINDLYALLNRTPDKIATLTYRQAYQSFVGKCEEERIRAGEVEYQYQVDQKLYDKGVIPRLEFEEKRHNRDLAWRHLKNIEEEQRLEWENRLLEVQQKWADLSSTRDQYLRERQNYIILAPISGTVTDLVGVKRGCFVAVNQQLGRISSNQDLLAECFVSPSDIGLIQLQMKVGFQFHAYNFNEWGMGSGTVIQMIKNPITLNDHPFYRIRCKLDREYLELPNGSRGVLRRGMTFTGRFLVAQRRLIQLLYDKTDNWINPRIKNE